MGYFRDQHIVAGYFMDAEKARNAGNALKEWDKAHDGIKLGGMGVTTYQNGKIKTKHIGRRHTGPAAGWGLALGAITGVLSGGVTLIGGAVAGSVLGGAGGALFRRHVGLKAADKVEIESFLRNGGALLVVMADEHEVAMTEAKIHELGGITKNYRVPDETMEAIASAEDYEVHEEEE